MRSVACFWYRSKPARNGNGAMPIASSRTISDWRLQIQDFNLQFKICNLRSGKCSNSQRHRPLYDVSTRNEAGPLKRLAARDIFRIASRGRYAPALVTDALQLLHQVRAQAASSERLAY